ncbi:MAG: DNA recombination protein RmuC [Candidatus Korobacteraceae bacterium]|jgi:DNA recombination protein RmuC
MVATVMLVFAAAAVAALVAYLATRSPYAARVAAADAVSSQLAEQVKQRDEELRDLREALQAEQQARTVAQTTLEDERRLLAEQKKTLDEAQNKLTEVFQGLAAQALVNNNQAFLNLASENFSGLRSNAVNDISNLVQPLNELLNNYQTNLQAIESARQQAYGELKSTLTSVSQTQDLLKQETSNLVTALRRPNVRGRWGELTLKRVAELTGMSEHCDFEEQVTVDGENGTLRPDMIIHLPREVIVPVDAKVPLDAYLDAIGATSDADRKLHLKRHAAALRERMRTLSAKEYAHQFQNTPGVTVLFLPSEAFLSAALEHDPALLEDAMLRNIVISTPVSLFSLLKAVAYGWQQDAIAKNAQAISDAGKDLYGRMQTLWGHLEDLRTGLIRSLEAFDKTVGSLEARILPGIRKFKELRATAEADIEPMEPIARAPRALSAVARPGAGPAEGGGNGSDS